jgi:hypothetical protein
MDQVIWSIMSVMWSGYAGTLVGAEGWENQPTADDPAFARDSLLLTPPTTVPSKWYLFVWCSSTNTSGAGSSRSRSSTVAYFNSKPIFSTSLVFRCSFSGGLDD